MLTSSVSTITKLQDELVVCRGEKNDDMVRYDEVLKVKQDNLNELETKQHEYGKEKDEWIKKEGDLESEMAKLQGTARGFGSKMSEAEIREEESLARLDQLTEGIVADQISPATSYTQMTASRRYRRRLWRGSPTSKARRTFLRRRCTICDSAIASSHSS